jgi:hypothetical protein
MENGPPVSAFPNGNCFKGATGLYALIERKPQSRQASCPWNPASAIAIAKPSGNHRFIGNP